MPSACRARATGPDEIDITILRALKEIGGPAKPKDIAEKAGLDARRVAAKMRKLLRLGLVERSEEGLYSITESGLKVIEEHS
ncbi:hypothetical protein Pyrde_1168 [Pyrodictium delaneyi]|uniref:MarR family transcriptional regulator n=1 Tax=Pyrodictium delaneyi TaxID=1273541 RepID=A0A0P0N3I0_9CREN|nr:winged helix-turn-helix transcriptional regulator [Pyrodictium delaneyi]ALL01216.1 hypothetical protein Pyrde_1168 [Pyrodictium delaneyi]OWJ55707.1 MarR family transcriptional regulator [Pyrodictium delaneyi]